MTVAIPAALSARSSLGRAMALLALLIAVVAALLWAATRDSINREVAQVTNEAGLITDARATAVSQWLAAQRAVVRSVADNPSVQLYADGVLAGDEATAQGQGSYLRTLLAASAARAGLLDGTAQIAANIPRPAAPGLAIMTTDGRALASVGGPLPRPDGLFDRNTRTLVMDTRTQLGAAGAATPAVRIAAAVDSGTNSVFVYLVRRLDTALADRLIQPGEPAAASEVVVLTRGPGGAAQYLTGRRGVSAGTLAPADPLALAALRPGNRSQVVSDTDGTQYLLTARAVPDSQWVVMRLARAASTLEPILARQRLWLWSVASGLGFFGLLVVLAWRQGITERAALAAATEGALRQQLQTVSDRQPTAIAVVEPAGHIRFANATAHAWAGAAPASLREVLGGNPPAAGSAAQVMISGARHLLVDQVPLDPAEPDAATLVTAQDISELVTERARREASLRALVGTLAGLIDARDPGSTHHSERVSALAVALGVELHLTERDLETLRIAGLLLNIGKVIVPRAILTKAGALTDDERATVADARARTAALLTDVPFDGPVAETIASASGASAPTQLGNVLIFANAYIGMISPRAHRDALSADAALAAIRTPENASMASALAHYLDNRGGRAALAPA